ncbi:hypothetical protein L7F22_024539, partial [Adiantum nelumboides]|nr:hypothetical protein [Adiantum nelumboides]
RKKARGRAVAAQPLPAAKSRSLRLPLLHEQCAAPLGYCPTLESAATIVIVVQGQAHLPPLHDELGIPLLIDHPRPGEHGRTLGCRLPRSTLTLGLIA